MRGRTNESPQLFAMFHVEDRIREDHPLRRIKEYADQILGGMSWTFTAMYSEIGRPSVPPEVGTSSFRPTLREGAILS